MLPSFFIQPFSVQSLNVNETDVRLAEIIEAIKVAVSRTGIGFHPAYLVL